MKFKANILLITLFLLMLSSLTALLITSYIRNLIRYSTSFHDYYQAYYIANAGLELSLVKTNKGVRGYGFEDIVLSGSSTMTNNFTGSYRYFSTIISSRATSLGDVNTSDPDHAGDTTRTCNATNVQTMGFRLGSGSCVPIIFLQDSATNFTSNEGLLINLPNSDLYSLSNDVTLYTTATGFTALVTQVDDNLDFSAGRSKTFDSTEVGSQMTSVGGGVYQQTTVIAETAPDIGINAKKILMIANTTTDDEYYCLESNNATIEIPTQFVTIQAQGKFNNVTVNLKGARRAGLPADFCYTAISG